MSDELTFKKILFPVDLSEVSPKIAPHVKKLKDQLGAELHVLFVARQMKHYGGLYVPHLNIKMFEDELMKGAKKKLREFLNETFSQVPLVSKVVYGDPAEEIINYAQAEGMDLIVMGTHGRKGLERILFGSVAEHVVKNSPVPVLTVNPYRIASA
ncbi:MAG: universal stress protein [Pseudomonadota bacterium]